MRSQQRKKPDLRLVQPQQEEVPARPSVWAAPVIQSDGYILWTLFPSYDEALRACRRYEKELEQWMTKQS